VNHIAVDSSGTLYLTAVQHNVLAVSTSNGQICLFSAAVLSFRANVGAPRLLAGSQFGYANGVGEGAQFKDPQGITVSSSRIIYVADDNNVIRRIDTSGILAAEYDVAGILIYFTFGRKRDIICGHTKNARKQRWSLVVCEVRRQPCSHNRQLGSDICVRLRVSQYPNDLFRFVRALVGLHFS
jgi:hypothetical protein